MAITHPRLTFLIAYYGKWPWYWNLWAQSVAANPKINFVIVTDLEPPSQLPSNVSLVRLQLDEVIRRFKDVTGVTLELSRLHKLCELKPFLALIVPEAVTKCEYWGYCDVDLVFGDLNPLIEAAKTGDADLISPWNHTVGHCTLLRNCKKVNQLALRTPNLAERLKAPEITFIDEGNMTELALRQGEFNLYLANDVSGEWHKPRCFLGATARPGGVVAGMSGSFIASFAGGKIMIFDREVVRHEVLYFHFMGMKSRRYWRKYDPKYTDDFSFTPYGYEPEVIKADIINSLRFRLRSVWHNAPPCAYSYVRSCVPNTVIQALKSIRLSSLKRR